MPGYIDNFATSGNPVVDITGTPINVLLNFEAKGAQAPADQPLAAFAGLLNLPPSILALLTTSLSTMFDQVWGQTKDSSGQTMLQRTQALMAGQISNAIQSQGWSVDSMSVNLPATGILEALVLTGDLADPTLSQVVFLSYQLNNASTNVTVNTHGIGNLFGDPSFNGSFNIEVLVRMGLPISIGALTPTASFDVNSANISAGNFSAGFDETIVTALSFLTGQPTNIFQTVEGQADSTGGSLPNLGQLTTLLSLLSSLWHQAAYQFGFRELTAGVLPPQGTGRSLTLRFTHPVDRAPQIVNAAISPYPSLFPPVLGCNPSVVQAGQSLTVNGTNFPVGQANSLYIAWNDTTSGAVTQSDINWGPATGPMISVSKPRRGNDGGNTFVASNLMVNTPYVFQVRDQDALTETPFTQPPFQITTQATDVVDLLLVSAAGAQLGSVGSARLTGTGAFVGTAEIPTSTPAGSYLLSAAIAGAIIASAPVQVVPANKPVPAWIKVIDPATQAVVSTVEEDYAFTLSGGGFPTGTVNLSIDTVTGQALGSLSSQGSEFQKSFTWPLNVMGQHNIVAEIVAGGQKYQAEFTVYAQALPQ